MNINKEIFRIIIHEISDSPLKNFFDRTIGLIINLTINRNNISIIHLQTSGSYSTFILNFIGLSLAKVLDKKFVMTFHYSQTDIFVRKFPKTLSFFIRNSEKFIVVSERQRQSISKLKNIPSGNIITIENGYDESLFKPLPKELCKKELNIDVKSKIIFHLSNLIPSKGQDVLIDATNILINVKGRDDLLIIIAGKGSSYNYLYSKIKYYKLEDYILLLGWIDGEEIPKWINASEFFVLPSYAEGNPTVMFETLGCGRPFIGTKIGGMPEIINEKLGLLVEAGDHIALAEVLLKALDTTWDYNYIHEHSKKYTWKEIALRTQNVYFDVIEH